MAFETAASQLAFLLGRLLFGGILAATGLNHFNDTHALTSYAESKGLPLPHIAVITSGLVILLGSLSIVLGAYPAVGSGLLLLFFVLVTPTMHDFWNLEDPRQKKQQLTDFLKNTSLAGGVLVFLSLTGTAWPYALNLAL